jgi:ribosome-binding protein aMBF1 (putative translation factor)
MEAKENRMISNWLKENEDPEINSFIEKNLDITVNVRKALENKGWKSQDLAHAMNKKPAEISKWLSGMHNLTLKSIIKMEQALGVDLILVNKIKSND